MANTNIVRLNLPAFTEYRRSPEVMAVLDTEAQRLADRANSRARGECEHPEHARFRALDARPTSRGASAIATSTGDPGCYRHNAKHNTLVNAMGGG